MGTDDPADPPTPPNPQVLNYQTATGAPQQWVTIYKAQNGAEANLAVMALQEKGLHARVDFENSATLGAWAGAGPGTATGVQVLAADVPAARVVIDQIDRRREARQESRSLKCPRCGTPNPKRILS